MSSSEGASPPPPPRQYTTEVLHQRRKMPLSPATMAVGGFLFVAALGYLTLFAKSKPGASPSEVAKVAANTQGGVEAAARLSK